MSGQIQIKIDQDLYDRLMLLMVPPISDANAVIRELLILDGRTGRSAAELAASEQHYTYEQELERSSMGVYDGGGGT
ncbi:MAG: hypothetical protein WC029_07105 [Sulfuricella sp.]